MSVIVPPTTVFNVPYKNRLSRKSSDFHVQQPGLLLGLFSSPSLSLGDKGLTDCLVHTGFHLFYGFPVIFLEGQGGGEGGVTKTLKTGD